MLSQEHVTKSLCIVLLWETKDGIFFLLHFVLCIRTKKSYLTNLNEDDILHRGNGFSFTVKKIKKKKKKKKKKKSNISR